jgi:release factor glutamine methyltransferase
MENTQTSVKIITDLFLRRLAGKYDTGEIRQFIYILMEEYTGSSRTDVHLMPQRTISGESFERLMKALSELEQYRPIQYITGHAWFDGMKLRVNEHVLIPRPETEELLLLVVKDAAAAGFREQRFLDIGTGSGCIAVGLKNHLPAAEVTAMDKSRNALEVARRNAESTGKPINLVLSDILEPVSRSGLGIFDVIVSNPPYVTESEKAAMKENVLHYEPAKALYVPDDDPLVFYKAIAVFSRDHLAGEGRLWLEINERFGTEVSDLLRSACFAEAEILKDIHDKPRFIKAVRKSG